MVKPISIAAAALFAAYYVPAILATFGTLQTQLNQVLNLMGG